MEFPCTKCGLCCRSLHLAEELRFLDRGDGTCRYFSIENNLCTIYEDRPEICRVKYQYQQNYKEFYSWEEFVEKNVEICNQLVEENEGNKVVSHK